MDACVWADDHAVSYYFELLRAFANQLNNDHLDEDQSEVEVAHGEHTQTYQQRMVTLRGELDGVAIVLIHQKYYFGEAGPPRFRDVMEIFTTDRSVQFEGTVSPASWWTKVLRVFGRGGITGRHPLYAEYALEFEIAPEDRRFSGAFESALFDHLQSTRCHELTLQAQTGLNGVYPGSQMRIEWLEALLGKQIGLWPALSR